MTTGLAPTPVGSFRRDLLIVVGLAASPLVALGCSRFAYALLLPAMRSELGWSFTTAGLMNTLNAVGYLVGALGTAWAAAKLGQRTAFVGSLAVTVLALAATAAVAYTHLDVYKRQRLPRRQRLRQPLTAGTLPASWRSRRRCGLGRARLAFDDAGRIARCRRAQQPHVSVIV